jgi:hypothetical protein
MRRLRKAVNGLSNPMINQPMDSGSHGRNLVPDMRQGETQSAPAQIKVYHVGNERQPVIVIDDLVEHPEKLVERAAGGSGFEPSVGDYYPGIRKPVGESYAEAILQGYQSTIYSVFGIEHSLVPAVVLCSFSISTIHPAQLLPIQRIPHFDSSDTNQIACIHYLCEPRHGGTSFYRHRQTGYEAIPEGRFRRYTNTLDRQAPDEAPTNPQYMTGDSALFKCIASYDARFNRALIYRSNVLHSGNIDPNNGLSPDPRDGRLTASTFIRFSAS